MKSDHLPRQLALALLAFAPVVRAHDLSVDHLTLWLDPSGKVLRGELTVRPELTRDRRAPKNANTEAELGRLIGRLRLRIDERACEPAIDVREIWQRGGAVSGDIVMLSCPVAPKARRIDVAITEPFDTLAVTVEYRDSGAGTAQSTLLRSGGRTHALALRAVEPNSGWRRGGAEQLGVPAPLARAASEAAAPPDAAAPPEALRSPSFWSVVGNYCRFGIEHILPLGLDHVAFVAALALGAKGRRALALDVTWFTLAHSLTLAVGASGWFALPGVPVEPLITFSIAVVGFENLLVASRDRGTAVGERRSSWLRRCIVFAFGLLHGLGFAGALRELRVAPDAFVPALLGFNVGVELAQLGVALVLVVVLDRTVREPGARSRVIHVGAWLFVALGLGWTGARIVQ